jgi:anthranilate synthase component 1
MEIQNIWFFKAQIIVKDQNEIQLYRGTFKRTGDDEKTQYWQTIIRRQKNSEHALVDLARNDLSRNGHNVNVEKYREVQFSHVIHLVSKVTVIYMKSNNYASSRRYFPAGTLRSLKHRAMHHRRI